MPDAYALSKRFSKFLRVTDVTDGLDALGRADHAASTPPSARSGWAALLGPRRHHARRARRPHDADRSPAKKPCASTASGRRWAAGPPSSSSTSRPAASSSPPSTARARPAIWGSNNSMDMQAAGVAGIVTDGHCRDTDEIILQKIPVACRGIGRTIIPGRVELMDINVPVGCGGVMVRPNDIVGCDWDGCRRRPARGRRRRAGHRRADRRRRQESPPPPLRQDRPHARRNGRLGIRRRVLQGPALTPNKPTHRPPDSARRHRDRARRPRPCRPATRRRHRPCPDAAPPPIIPASARSLPARSGQISVRTSEPTHAWAVHRATPRSIRPPVRKMTNDETRMTKSMTKSE